MLGFNKAKQNCFPCRYSQCYLELVILNCSLTGSVYHLCYRFTPSSFPHLLDWNVQEYFKQDRSIKASSTETQNLKWIPFKHLLQPANKGMNAANSEHSLTHLDLSSVGTNSDEVVVADFNTDQKFQCLHRLQAGFGHTEAFRYLNIFAIFVCSVWHFLHPHILLACP